jgi:hypothetical protein
MEQSRGALQTKLGTELTDFANKIATNLPTNAVGGILATAHRAVNEDLRAALETLLTDYSDSHLNKITDTSDNVAEGATNKYAIPATLLAWIENATLVSTDNLNEGTSNLYYTDTRVDNRINQLRPEQSAITNLAMTASATYQTAQIQTLADKIDSILTALRGHNVIV